MTYETMRVEKVDGIAEVVLASGKGNLMAPTFFRELPRVFEDLDLDSTVRVVVLRGDGGVFSHGLDLKEAGASLMRHIAPPGNLAGPRLELLQLITQWQEGFDRVERCRTPVIAAVAGACIGGGLDLIAACDVRLAARNARFSLREVKLAIVADMGSLQRLPRIIGHGHTRELAFTGKDIGADRALHIGLVNDVYEDEAALLAAARAMARSIADNSPIAVQGIKRVLAYGEGKTPADAAQFVAVWNAAFLASADLNEALAAFIEKRSPRFTGA